MAAQTIFTLGLRRAQWYNLAVKSELQSLESTALLASLRTAVVTHELLTQPDPDTGVPLPVVVGVSGGADSVCLLHALHALAPELSLALHVAHLDHALRPTSATEAEHVASLAQMLGLPFHTHKLASGALHKQPGGLENAARQARYCFLAAVAHQVTPPLCTPIIAVAHHADDQAETVFMNVVRGSGLPGLSGMKPLSLLDPAFTPPERPSTQPPVRLVRPLLNIPKSAILAYLKQQQVAWLEDESNQQLIYTRNLLRNQVLPLLRQINPNLTATIGRTAHILAAEAERIEELDRAQFKHLLLGQTDAHIVLDAARLLKLPLAAQRNVVRMALHALAAAAMPPAIAMQHIEQILSSLHAELRASGPHPITQTLSWTVAGPSGDNPARLSLHHADAPPFAPDAPHLAAPWRADVRRQPVETNTLIQIGAWHLAARLLPRAALPVTWRQVSPWTAYLDAEQIGRPLLTTPQFGMRFAPLGLNGHHKTLGDFFTARKVHPTLRSGWPIVIDDETGAILWVCGLQIAHPPRITHRTQQVLQLIWSHLIWSDNAGT